MQPSKITDWCHHVIRSIAPRGGVYIDATMGNGYDTAFLCELADLNGRVYAFDIQEIALENTKARLEQCDYLEKAQLILDSHENMGRYFSQEAVDVIVFNFGYLPGGDHSLSTKPETSIVALKVSFGLLKRGGVMSLCIYSGGDTGFEEREKVLQFLKELSAKEYTVIVNDYVNVGNHSPLPIFIFKKGDRGRTGKINHVKDEGV